jgi:hypothetical protein
VRSGIETLLGRALGCHLLESLVTDNGVSQWEGMELVSATSAGQQLAVAKPPSMAQKGIGR